MHHSSSSPKRSSIFNQGLSLSHSQSASTLQHASYSWAFPKAERFPKIRTSSEFSSVLDLPTTLSNKATTFGFGNKIVMSEVNSKQAKDNPGPDRYNLKSDFDVKNKGRSFGLPFSVYAKNYLPGVNLVPPEIAKDYPGPGAYTIDDPIGAKKPKITLKPRGRMFNEVVGNDTPSSNYYSPSHTLVSPSRYKNTSFGFGQRYDFTKAVNQNPGPGTYKIPSKFDKYTKKNMLYMKASQSLLRKEV